MAGTSRKRRWYSHARRALPTGAANHPRAIGTGPANFRPQQTGRSRFSRLQHLGRRWSSRIAEKVGGIGFTALDQLDQLPAGERAADRAGVRGHPNREGLQAGESAGALCSYRGRMLSTSGALQPLAARPRPGCGSPRRAWGAQTDPAGNRGICAGGRICAPHGASRKTCASGAPSCRGKACRRSGCR